MPLCIPGCSLCTQRPPSAHSTLYLPPARTLIAGTIVVWGGGGTHTARPTYAGEGGGAHTARPTYAGEGGGRIQGTALPFGSMGCHGLDGLPWAA